MSFRLASLVVALVSSIVASACGGSAGDVPSGAARSANGSSGSPDGNPPVVDSGASGEPCNADGAVPTSPGTLQTWLAKGAYRCWAHESVSRPSSGPHGSEVQTYLNAKLDASMKTSAEHPQGASAVKELFGSGGKDITGWAVLLKTQPSSASGQGYYWYETFNSGAGLIEGQGKALCVNCHSAGKDFVLTPYPLR